MSSSSDLSFTDRFVRRHVGPDEEQARQMLRALGCESLDQLIEQTIPKSLRTAQPLTVPAALSETEALAELKCVAAANQVFRSCIGMGYHGTITPGVIQRNILENPGWYTQYTPYQPEISQGRLEALLNYQTAIIDLTGLPVANASLLDEATAAAEAMALIHRVKGGGGRETFLVADDCHPQTIDLVTTRATPLGITVKVGPASDFVFDSTVYGCLVQYPATCGTVRDYRPLIQKAQAANVAVAMACDPLSLTLLTPPGELGADIALGSAQRFGVPMGYGGPHAAFLAVKDDYKRQIPGRVIGVSQDAEGRPALRMALQTREQHIRREKATSNICTAQVLLAVMAGMYCVYHGPDGLKAIAERVHRFTKMLAKGASELGLEVVNKEFFDTLTIEVPDAAAVHAAARAARINFREAGPQRVGISLDETISAPALDAILKALALGKTAPTASSLAASVGPGLSGPLARESAFLTHPVFSSHRSETQMLRYIRKLESRDLSLTSSMIPLGSCTMKLNATAEMFPVTWPEFGGLHPFAPADQAQGYARLFETLSSWLNDITGFDACSLQPNSGAQGEYAGLLAIRAYHEARGESHRDTCLIPQSAHGTNPASAAMAGMKVVVTKTDADGNIDMADLKAKAAEHSKTLAALMVTYPSTHGVFEATIKEACDVIHSHGGKVYMDGANLNAQVGVTRPAELGADVCHINLHKTFCIPHGGGGPGMGPICCNTSLAPFLPGHPVVKTGGAQATGAVSAAPWGSASILVISWMYIRMMGPDGLTHATKTAILNANYIATRLAGHYPVLYAGANGRVAHECILDCRALEKASGITVGDIGRRLMDYGFHAPTISFPVAGTVMVEPTESEDLAELDRFCDAMIGIRKEIQEVADGKADRTNNVVTNAPHTARLVTSTEWTRPYSRERAAWPAPWTREHKFWPFVGKIDSAFGDRNLVCACPPMEAYES